MVFVDWTKHNNCMEGFKVSEPENLTVGRLKELLSKVPDDVLVMSEYDGGYNSVGYPEIYKFTIKTFKKSPPLEMVWSQYEEDEKGNVKGIVI
jgi:hypothetical protein